MRKTIVALCAGLLGFGVSVGAAGAQQLPMPGPSVPVLENCSFGKVEVRPAFILLYCADAHSALHDISWRSWSVERATGRGLLKELTCVPSCATGGYTARWVDFTLGGLVWRNGEPQFTRVYVEGREYRID